MATVAPGTALLIVLRVHGIAPAAAHVLFAVVAVLAVLGLGYTFGNISRPPGEPMTKRESAILWPLAAVTAIILAINFYQVAVSLSASSIFSAQHQ
jgi:hypothetical protein